MNPSPDMADHPARPITDVLDAGQLWERLENDRGLLGRLVHLFEDDSASLLLQIAGSIERRDGAELARAAHTLKGSIGMFAPLVASRSVLTLEELGRTLDFVRAEVVRARLVEEIHELLDALRKVLAEGAS